MRAASTGHGALVRVRSIARERGLYEPAGDARIVGGSGCGVAATRDALSGDVAIAYQERGDGLLDLVAVPAFVTNVELMWESEPGMSSFYRRLG